MLNEILLQAQKVENQFKAMELTNKTKIEKYNILLKLCVENNFSYAVLIYLEKRCIS